MYIIISFYYELLKTLFTDSQQLLIAVSGSIWLVCIHGTILTALGKISIQFHYNVVKWALHVFGDFSFQLFLPWILIFHVFGDFSFQLLLPWILIYGHCRPSVVNLYVLLHLIYMYITKQKRLGNFSHLKLYMTIKGDQCSDL